jgi:hypothetical protein
LSYSFDDDACGAILRQFSVKLPSEHCQSASNPTWMFAAFRHCLRKIRQYNPGCYSHFVLATSSSVPVKPPCAFLHTPPLDVGKSYIFKSNAEPPKDMSVFEGFSNAVDVSILVKASSPILSDEAAGIISERSESTVNMLQSLAQHFSCPAAATCYAVLSQDGRCSALCSDRFVRIDAPSLLGVYDISRSECFVSTLARLSNCDETLLVDLVQTSTSPLSINELGFAPWSCPVGVGSVHLPSATAREVNTNVRVQVLRNRNDIGLVVSGLNLHLQPFLMNAQVSSTLSIPIQNRVDPRSGQLRICTVDFVASGSFVMELDTTKCSGSSTLRAATKDEFANLIAAPIVVGGITRICLFARIEIHPNTFLSFSQPPANQKVRVTTTTQGINIRADNVDLDDDDDDDDVSPASDADRLPASIECAKPDVVDKEDFNELVAKTKTRDSQRSQRQKDAWKARRLAKLAELQQSAPKQRDSLYKELDNLRNAHISSLKIREARNRNDKRKDDSDDDSSNKPIVKYKVGYHHTRTKKRIEGYAAAATNDASKPVPGVPSDVPPSLVAAANAISDAVSSVQTDGAHPPPPAKKERKTAAPVIIPSLLRYAGIEDFIRKYAAAHHHCLDNSTRDDYNRIPKKHYSQEQKTAYKHVLDFHHKHQTRVSRSDWLIRIIQDYGLIRKRWKSKNVWPIGDDVLVCRQCFCTMHGITQSFVSNKIKEVMKGNTSSRHGNCLGAGRDSGMKILQVRAGMDAVLKRSGCDYMPHKNAIRTGFATMRELTAEVKKVPPATYVYPSPYDKTVHLFSFSFCF